MYKKHTELVFTAGTFLLSYGLWAICILGQRLGWFTHGSAWFMPFYILGGNVPPIIAYFVRKRTEDVFTFKTFVKDAFDLKQKPSHYALTLVMVALFYAVGAVMGGIQSETSPGLEERGVSGYIPLYLTLIGFPLFFFGGGSEELGWRGVLQPGLEKKLPFIPATVITAVVWTFWHLPLWWINGSGQGETSFWLFFVTVTGYTFALAAIRKTTGSVWLCVLFHCLMNSLQGTWYVKDELPYRAVITIVYIVLSVAIVHYYERRRKFNPAVQD